MLDPDGLRLLCCAMINRAMLDMRSKGEGGPVNIQWLTYRAYVDAVLWLGSSKASVYFDYVGAIEQKEALEGCDWLSYARQLRWDKRAKLKEDEKKLLDEGIQVLGKRRQRLDLKRQSWIG